MDANLSVVIPMAATAAAPAKHVCLTNAGLMEKPDGEIVAHGWIDIASMRALKVGDYQREVLTANSGQKKTTIYRALQKGHHLPDVMLGMRGENFDSKGDNITLLDKVYIIDGLQRVSQLLAYSEANPSDAASYMIGAEVRFNTTPESEQELFVVLNTSRTSVAPNVILRNLRTKSSGIAAIQSISIDPKFPLCGRVCWTQRMQRHELINATSIVKTVRSLHSLTGRKTSSGGSGGVNAIAVSLDLAIKRIGINVFRKNIQTFFDVIDQSFGLRTIQYKDAAPQLKANFLLAVARMFSGHANFWDKTHKELVIPALYKDRLATFPLQDPEVRRLVAAGAMAQDFLYDMLVKHMNKSRRVNQLKPVKCEEE